MFVFSICTDIVHLLLYGVLLCLIFYLLVFRKFYMLIFFSSCRSCGYPLISSSLYRITSGIGSEYLKAVLHPLDELSSSLDNSDCEGNIF